MESNASAKNRHLVAMSNPGRGHVNPMLNLCKLLASKSPNLHITIVLTEDCHRILTESEPPLPPNLRFGIIPQVVPTENDREKDFHAFVEATLTKMEAPFERILDRLEPPPTAIVYDNYLYWAVGVAKRRNLPVAAFCTLSASMFTVLAHFELLAQNRHHPLQPSEGGSEIVDYIPGLPPTSIHDFPKMFDGNEAKLPDGVLESVAAVHEADFLLLTSIPELEGSAIEALKLKFSPSTTVIPVGPMIPYFNPKSNPHNQHYIQWLDSQPTGSVLYISMGSFLSASTDQMNETLAGIRESGVRYLWVTRGADLQFNGDEKGCLVRWCDQLAVLSHRAVGGFWSHCGWNSISEAGFAGVPVMICPLFWDQFLNGKMVVEEWKMGERVKRGGGKGVVKREEIAAIVRGFMESGGEGRRKMMEAAEEVSMAYKRAVAPGGVVSFNLDSFLTRIE